MKQTRAFNLFSTAAFSVLLLAGAASAQPDLNNAPKADNPENWQQRGGNGGGRGGRGGRVMTAEERAQLVARTQEMRGQMIKAQLGIAGFNDATVQTAVVAFVKDLDTAQQKLQEKWQQINEGLRNNAMTEAQMATLVNDLRAMLEEEKARRTKAEAALDAQIGYTKKPKLDAVLMVLGITGDESAIVNSLTGSNARVRMMGDRNMFIAQAGPGGGNFNMTLRTAPAGGFGALNEDGPRNNGGPRGGRAGEVAPPAPIEGGFNAFGVF